MYKRSMFFNDEIHVLRHHSGVYWSVVMDFKSITNSTHPLADDYWRLFMSRFEELVKYDWRKLFILLTLQLKVRERCNIDILGEFI